LLSLSKTKTSAAHLREVWPGHINNGRRWSASRLRPIEEFGWRGVAQPILQRHMAPIWAGVLIGIIWGFWHLPAFFLSGTVYAN